MVLAALCRTDLGGTEEVNLRLCKVESICFGTEPLHMQYCASHLEKKVKLSHRGISYLCFHLQKICIRRILTLHSTSHWPGSEEGKCSSVLLLRHSLRIQGKCPFLPETVSSLTHPFYRGW